MVATEPMLKMVLREIWVPSVFREKMVQLDLMDLKDQRVDLETRVQIPRNPRERKDQTV